MILLLLSLAAAAPAMVTTARGDVKVAGAAAPAAPFLLQEGQALELAPGAEVVVLASGRASHLTGPKTVPFAELGASVPAAGDSASALSDLLSRQTVTQKAAASRAGDRVTLARPLPGSVLLQPREIRWTCGGCGAVEVQVYDFLADRVLWSAKAEGAATYAGPALGPGTYSIVLDGQDFTFSVPSDEQRQRVELALTAASEAVAALRGQGVTDPAALAAIPATLYLQAGMPSEALAVLDAAVAANPEDADLRRLLADFEGRAGAR